MNAKSNRSDGITSNNDEGLRGGGDRIRKTESPLPSASNIRAAVFAKRNIVGSSYKTQVNVCQESTNIKQTEKSQLVSQVA